MFVIPHECKNYQFTFKLGFEYYTILLIHHEHDEDGTNLQGINIEERKQSKAQRGNKRNDNN